MSVPRSLLMRLAAAGAILGAFLAVPQPTSASHLVLLSGFPALHQQHSLTCESSAASMATRGLISESQIMAAMPRSRNPNLGFRGNPDGFEGTSLVDYGVYAGPIQVALQHFDYHSNELLPGNDAAIRSYIDRGWPVVTWITYNLKRATPRLSSAKGVQFFLVPNEHAVLVIGYDNRSIIANDPWTRTRVRYYWSEFNRSWGYFGNMALAVEPCAVPAEVPGESVRMRNLTASSVSFSWSPALHAVSYAVAVHLVAEQRQLVFKGTQTATRITLANPLPGGQYQIAIKPISSCGGSPATTRLVVQLPDVLPTPTPTTTPEGTLTPTSTPTTTVTPTVTPTPSH